MKISNEQIIQSARRQRESVNSRMGVETWHPHHRHSRGIAAAIAIAASFISFIAGYGVRATSSQWHKTFLCNTTPLCIPRLSVTPSIRHALSLSM